MQTGANVRSIHAVRDFRAQALACAHELRSAIDAYRTEVQRGLDWILQQEPARWKAELRRAEENVMQAKRELEHRLSIKVTGQQVTAIEEKKALDRAKTRLRYVEEKQDVVKRLGFEVEREAAEYLAHASQSSSNIEATMSRAAAELDRALSALDRYVHVSSGTAADTPSVAQSPPPASPPSEIISEEQP